MPAGQETTGRSRRSGAEIRQLLLDSARELFATKGYNSTTTREISARVGVSEPLLYKHFGSKANLFELAVIKPFRDFVVAYAAQWETESPEEMSVEDMSREFVTGLFRLFRRNREMVTALLAAHAYDVEVAGTNGSATQAIGGALGVLERLCEVEAVRRPLAGLDPPLTIRVTVGMVMAMAVFDEWLFPTGPKPSQKRLLDEMTQYMAYGLSGRPSPA